MKKKSVKFNRDKLNHFGISILTGVLAFALSSAAIQYIDLDPWMAFSYGRIFLSVLFTLTICILIFKNWKRTLIALGVVALIAIIIGIIWSRTGIPETLSENAQEYFEWLKGFITQWHDGIEMSWRDSYITSVTLSVMITVLMYFLLVKWFVYIPVFIMSATLFVAQWAVVREVNKFAFYLTLAVLVLLYFFQNYIGNIRNVFKMGEKHEFLTPGKFLIAALPVVAVIMVLVLLIPKSSEPIKWKWLDDKIKYRNLGGDKPIDFKAYEEFSLANTGFSAEPGKPGGSVNLDYSHMLDVYSSKMTYIRGESWPYFDGIQWGDMSADIDYTEPVVPYDDYEPERRMLLEPVYGWRFMLLNDWLNNEFDDYEGRRILPGPDFDVVMGEHLLPSWAEKEKLDIVYAGVETKTLFAPMYSLLTSREGLADVLAETNDTLETEDTTRLFSFIHYDYLQIDRENENLIETLRRSYHGIYYQTYSNLAYITNNESTYEEKVYISNTMLYTLQDLYELYAMAEDYYWRYTAVSDAMPDRVRNLAREITDSYDNDYDKVTAIEEYFHTGFTYSLEVPEIPAERDFVDWFIFDSKVGYCTYYATAMTNMVRSIGLPARYVEGFLTPPSPAEENRYPVLNSNGHAWVEVYFEGVGWIRFEPTPPFARMVDGDTDPFPIPDTEIEDPLDEHLDELDKEDLNDGVITPGGGGTESGRKESMPTWILILIISGGALVALNISVNAARKLLFKNINNKRRFSIGYHEILRFVRLRGFKIKKGMTLMELADDIDNAYYAPSVSMRDLTDVYYRILYDDKKIPEDQFRIMEIFYQDFKSEFNNELKLWEWIVYRILTPLI